VRPPGPRRIDVERSHRLDVTVVCSSHPDHDHPEPSSVVDAEPGAILETFSLDADWFGDNRFISVEEA